MATFGLCVGQVKRFCAIWSVVLEHRSVPLSSGSIVQVSVRCGVVGCLVSRPAQQGRRTAVRSICFFQVPQRRTESLGLAFFSVPPGTAASQLTRACTVARQDGPQDLHGWHPMDFQPVPAHIRRLCGQALCREVLVLILLTFSVPKTGFGTMSQLYHGLAKNS